MAQKAAMLALCAGFGLYTTSLAEVGVRGLAVDRAGAPPYDPGTACVDLILAAPVGGTFG